MATLFLIGQVLLGLYFVKAGVMHFVGAKGLSGYAASKKLPLPMVSVYVSGLMLLLGGLGVVFQYQLTIAYSLLILFLVVAAFSIHAFWNVEDQMAKMGDRINFEKNIALASALLMLLAAHAML